MFGSVSQCCSRSLPLTSALLPTETNSEMPIPSSPAAAHQLDPETTRLRQERDRAARRASTGANVAFIRTSGAVFTMPRQFGPITRMPLRRAVATMRAARRPCRSVTDLGEAGGDDHDAVHLLLRALVDDARTRASAGTTTSATSTVSGTSRMLGYARTPATDTEVGLTGYTGPWKSYASRLRNSSWPIVPACTARADDRDRTRRQQPRRRRGLRAVLACLDRRDRVVGRLDRETNADGAFLELRVPLSSPRRRTR